MTGASKASGGVLRSGVEVADPRVRQCTEHRLGHEGAAVAAHMRRRGTEALSSAGGGERRAVRMDGPKFCSYEPGSYFRTHRDASSDPLDPPAVVNRQLTLVCLLNDDSPADGLPTFDGGTLVVHLADHHGEMRPVNVQLAAGSIVAFGAALLHEVRPVRTGTRFAAVAWLYDVDLPPPEPRRRT